MVYTFNRHESVQWTPTWCYFFELCLETLPQTFRTASKWLTVALAIQRYIYACMPFAAERLCTLRTSLLITATLVAVALIQMIPRTVDRNYMIHMDSMLRFM